MVLAGGHGQRVPAVADDDEAGFLALQEFLDDDLVAGTAEAAGEHGFGRRHRFGRGLRNDHALAGRQSAGLDDDGHGLRRQPCRIEVSARERAVAGGGNPVPGEEFLGERLGSFELRRRLAWSEAGQAARLEQVDDAGHQWHFRSDDGERNGFAGSQVGEAFEVLGGDIDIAHLGFTRRAGIAGRHQHLADTRRLRAFPRQRVLAAATADDQYLDACARHSVPEVAHAGEQHGQSMFVGRCNDLGVAHRAAGLDHRGHALAGGHIHAIAEREEGIRGHDRAAHA